MTNFMSFVSLNPPRANSYVRPDTSVTRFSLMTRLFLTSMTDDRFTSYAITREGNARISLGWLERHLPCSLEHKLRLQNEHLVAEHTHSRALVRNAQRTPLHHQISRTVVAANSRGTSLCFVINSPRTEFLLTDRILRINRYCRYDLFN